MTTVKVVVENDGFIEVKRKKNKSKQPRQVDGIRITKPSLNLHYKRVKKGESSKFQQPANTKKIYVPVGEKVTNEASSSDETNSYPKVVPPKLPEEVVLKNLFASLPDKDASEWGSEEAWNNAKRVLKVINESDSEDVDQEIIMEERSGVSSFGPAITEGARYIQWRALWEKLGMHKVYVCNRPWCMLGDFNAALNLEDISGLMFTWNQKPKGSDGVLKKIDRVMANLEFNDVFAGSYAVFQPYRISDHAPCVLKIPLLTNTALRPFKFANFLVHNDRLDVDIAADIVTPLFSYISVEGSFGVLLSNALADLGANINVMPFSMFKRLGLGNPKPDNMVIEMADRSMQSPKGIVENVLTFLEENLFGSRNGEILFNANEGANPSTVSPVCVINDYDDSGGPEDLEELLMNDDINGDLGDLLKDNDLLPNFDAPEVIPLSLLADHLVSIGILLNNFKTDSNMGIEIDDFVKEMDDL
ncbi:RNA-directed DNA polymerase, eukaryota, reverse transcriptase zinc-binding domain protein [Tanacetum coccineum]